MDNVIHSDKSYLDNMADPCRTTLKYFDTQKTKTQELKKDTVKNIPYLFPLKLWKYYHKLMFIME